MTVKIFHNPRCSKSRATLSLLRDNGVEPEVVEYLATPPTAAEFKSILKKMGAGPRDVIRRGEKIFKELELDDPSLPDNALITAMVEHPILIERPIVISGDKAALGRPPEKVLEIVKSE